MKDNTVIRVDFRVLTLRKRIQRMAAEHMAMQEGIMQLPPFERVAGVLRLDRHAADLSCLATELASISPEDT